MFLIQRGKRGEGGVRGIEDSETQKEECVKKDRWEKERREKGRQDVWRCERRERLQKEKNRK